VFVVVGLGFYCCCCGGGVGLDLFVYLDGVGVV